MKKQYKLSLVSVLMIISITAIVFISYAYFASKDNITNIVNVGDVDIEVSESFTPPTSWNGSDYSKVVKIQNNSKSPALIRVSIIPRWVDANNNAWPGDTNLVKLNYVTNNIISSANITPKDKWVDGKDGYYYYNTIVAHTGSTVEILNSVSADVPIELKDRYKDKKLIIDVKAEAVQGTRDAHRSTWSNINEGSELKNMLDSLCNR